MLKETLEQKTVNGKLVFTGGGAKPPEDPNSTKVATPQAPKNQKHQQAAAPQTLFHQKNLPEEGGKSPELR